MKNEYDELNDMLKDESEEIKSSEEISKKDITDLLNKIKNYDVIPIDISKKYNLEDNFDKFKIEDSLIRNKLNNDIINYKISLLNTYIEELYLEKKFNEYKTSKEQELSSQDYLDYIHNVIIRSQQISKWFNEFSKKN